MTSPKKIPYAVANYEKIVDEDYHFVDKTRFIRELEKYQVPVLLRPRRFGKSLWCSILQCYYDVNRKNRFQQLFEHTDIGKNPTSSRNSQLVLRFDFSKLKLSKNIEDLEQDFNELCRVDMRTFLTLNDHYFKGAVEWKTDSAHFILNNILGRITGEGLPRLLIIVDEYDNFTNQLLTSHQDELYSEVTTGDSFLQAFFKTIKAGIGDRVINRVFITGILPITMDDLTSGFNISQIITLKKNTLEMMGFTQDEVDTYVDDIFKEHGWDTEKRQQVRDELRSHYNGYRLLPEAKTLYNSTICNFYLNDLVLNDGEIPTERIDHNLRVDINWLRRLTGNEEETRRLLEQLMFNGTLPVDMTMLESAFSMQQFFERRFFPLSLYYLGMLTFEDEYTLCFPNLTVKTIFAEYFNEVEKIEVSLGYTEHFKTFHQNKDWSALFAGYWDEYVGQIPAQAFDKVNENFFRTTFYELCVRYLKRSFIFSIEVNCHSGRSDFEGIGRAGTAFEHMAVLIEFKHFPTAKSKSIMALTEPLADDIQQVLDYSKDLQRKGPKLNISRYLIYTIGAEGYRFFNVD